MNQVRKIPRLPGTILRIDWQSLKEEWLGCLLSKNDFLKSYGIKPTQGSVRRATKKWELEGKDLHGLGRVTEKDLEKNEPESDVDAKSTEEDTWKTFQDWRKGQGVSDWKIANKIKRHVQVMLSTSMLEDSKGQLKSELSPSQLNSMSITLANIQKIQRLALGMSTDNHGVIQPMDPNVVKQKNTEEEILFPTFVVEMEEGKFKRSRPKQIA